MKVKQRIIGIALLLCAISVMAGYALSVPQDDRTRQRPNRQEQTTPQDDRTRQRPNRQGQTPSTRQAGNGNQQSKPDDKNKPQVNAQPILDTDEEIPDSLLHPRWKIQRTVPVTDDDLRQGSADLQRPENLRSTATFLATRWGEPTYGHPR